MIEILCVSLALIFVVGGGHIALLNGLFWLLDSGDGIDYKWGMDTMMVLMLIPVAVALASVEIYLLYGKG